jgi:Spy/CpxP family protein refolding chaperone
MRRSTFIAAFAVLALVAACEKSPTQPSALDSAQLETVDPAILTFNSTSGLPAEPFHTEGPGSRGDARGPGAPFPDSLKLTDAQKAAIKALRDAFNSANTADLAALQAIHDKARDAMKAHKTREEVKAILETAKPIMERLMPRFDALHVAIDAVLTTNQKAWIAAHHPLGPPPGFHP